MKDESGAALVEFASIAPALTLLIIGGLDLGLELLNQERLLFCDTASRRR
jgi:Flp pilus assembly pilin Flp